MSRTSGCRECAPAEHPDGVRQEFLPETQPLRTISQVVEHMAVGDPSSLIRYHRQGQSKAQSLEDRFQHLVVPGQADYPGPHGPADPEKPDRSEGVSLFQGEAGKKPRVDHCLGEVAIPQCRGKELVASVVIPDLRADPGIGLIGSQFPGRTVKPLHPVHRAAPLSSAQRSIRFQISDNNRIRYPGTLFSPPRPAAALCCLRSSLYARVPTRRPDERFPGSCARSAPRAGLSPLRCGELRGT